MEKSDHRGALQENPISLLGDQDSESDQTVRLVRGNLSVLGALELLVIQAGKRLVFSADGAEMAEFVAVPDAPMVPRTFDISSVPELQGVSPYILPAPVAVTEEPQSERSQSSKVSWCDCGRVWILGLFRSRSRQNSEK